jgi:hypothetical protein
LTSSSIAGTNDYRTVVKPTEANKTLANSEVGVNASCREGFSCTCDTAWSGDQQGRELWNQATNMGGAGTLTSKVSAVKANAVSGNVMVVASSTDPDKTYKVTVRIKDQHPENEAQAKKQGAKAEKAHADHLDAGIAISSQDNLATISCPGKCDGTFSAGATIELNAADMGDIKFIKWSGNTCSRNNGLGRKCVIRNINGDVDIEAYYRR